MMGPLERRHVYVGIGEEEKTMGRTDRQGLRLQLLDKQILSRPPRCPGQ
jgi:hypothetical protein